MFSPFQAINLSCNQKFHAVKLVAVTVYLMDALDNSNSLIKTYPHTSNYARAARTG